MFNDKLYKPNLYIQDLAISLKNSKELTGKCGREIIAYQNGLCLKSLAHKKIIAEITYFSIKYN